ncbi:DUF2339 domain-containing protein [uncultured Parasphingorhabdus sp.]|uniref:DUF2339 domain-containing protein n=1 Tax=uncultured Parasphingorhabdus sp. TaxID=2709694 RepID=UPI0030DDB7DD|tara:strand:- start:25077 stop:28655 length:3579 start_codon:yes stop_codon:yes gene_type:complete
MMTFFGFIVAFALIWSMAGKIRRLERQTELLEDRLGDMASNAAAKLADSLSPRPESQAVEAGEAGPSTMSKSAAFEEKALVDNDLIENPDAEMSAALPEQQTEFQRAKRIASVARVADGPLTQSEMVRSDNVTGDTPANYAPTIADKMVAEQPENSATEDAVEQVGEPLAVESREEEFSQEEAPPKSRGISFSFEDLFGRRLPIWAGGITLAIAGVLIVKYAIDAGIFGRVFTPTVQIICGLLFGSGLIAGAEAARRYEARVQDPRVAQALSGAGIATLYAAVLMASNFYQLISPLTAFIAFAAITAAALGLSIRFGPPTALLGLAGGLAAPAMIGGLDSNVSLLAVYLGLTIAGMAGVSRMQRWPMLGLAALVGGAGWSLWMILASNALDVIGSLSVGGFVILLAIGLPLLVMRGPRAALMRSAAAIVGAAQLAMLVAFGGFEPLHWGLFALLAAAGQWLSWREKGFEIVPTISLGTSVMLLAIWGDASAFWFTLIGGSLAVIHAGPLLWKMWRIPSRVQDALELSGLAVAIPALSMIHFYLFDGSRDLLFAVLTFAASLIPAVAVATGWKSEGRDGDTRFMWLTATSGILLVGALCFAMPSWLWPLGLAAVAAGLLLFGERASDHRLEPVSAIFAAATFPLALITMQGDGIELVRLVSGNGAAIDIHAGLRWTGLTALFLVFAMRASIVNLRHLGFSATGIFAYFTLAQILPGWALPIGLALIAVAMLFAGLKQKEPVAEKIAAVFALATIPLLMITGDGPINEWTRLFGGTAESGAVIAALRWASLAALGVLFAMRSQFGLLRIAAQIAATLMAYGAISQILPVSLLPLLAPVAMTGLAIWTRRLSWPELAPAAGVLALFVIGWAMVPIWLWLPNALPALVGQPMTIVDPSLTTMMIAKQLLLPALLLGFQLGFLRERLPSPVRDGAAAIAAVMSLISIHSLYRIGFANIFGTDFVEWGLLQRLIWEALLIAAGWLIYRFVQSRFGQDQLLQRGATALVLAGSLHNAWFTLLLHNPLWAAQAVGSMPIVNLLVPAFAMAIGGIILLRSINPDQKLLGERPVQAIKMILILLFAWASLRQFFHGSLLVAPGVFDAEDILRSILAIGLAIGFLLWGIRSEQRDWRIASLVLILLAVCKVFFFDASGLEGLTRIGSFVALGFSLIGIGWLYSRQLGRDAIAQNPAAEDSEPS